jgi:hypothetical protein
LKFKNGRQFVKWRRGDTSEDWCSRAYTSAVFHPPSCVTAGYRSHDSVYKKKKKDSTVPSRHFLYTAILGLAQPVPCLPAPISIHAVKRKFKQNSFVLLHCSVILLDIPIRNSRIKHTSALLWNSSVSIVTRPRVLKPRNRGLIPGGRPYIFPSFTASRFALCQDYSL